jgi:hypothetical protein
VRSFSHLDGVPALTGGVFGNFGDGNLDFHVTPFGKSANQQVCKSANLQICKSANQQAPALQANFKWETG